MSAYGAPARRVDSSDLSPTWICVGTADLFHDECASYVSRLRAAALPDIPGDNLSGPVLSY